MSPLEETQSRPSLEAARRAFAEQVEETFVEFSDDRSNLGDLRPEFWETLAALLALTRYWRSDEPMCCVCECTENSPCIGGCHWIATDDMLDRCSQCADRTIPDRDQAVAEFVRSKHKLLGAPGDFGYSHPTGRALQALYERFNAFLSERQKAHECGPTTG